MLENQSKKILLLSDDAADASFLAEIAVMQQATIEVAADASDLCAKIAEFRADGSLAAIYVDVSTPPQLRKFEFEFQAKLGSALAFELSRKVHFISEESAALHREPLQSPYFSFFTERTKHQFKKSAHFYLHSLRWKESSTTAMMGFDTGVPEQFFDAFKERLRSKGSSVEWILKVKPALEEMIEEVFSGRFDGSFSFSEQSRSWRVHLESKKEIDREKVPVEKILHFGVSAVVSSQSVTLFVPVFEKVFEAVEAFRFYQKEI